jgi:hypothetical protein
MLFSRKPAHALHKCCCDSVQVATAQAQVASMLQLTSVLGVKSARHTARQKTLAQHQRNNAQVGGLAAIVQASVVKN